MATERLNVMLTEEERSRHAREAAHLLGVYSEVESRAKLAASEAREELKELNAKIDAHARASRTGFEEREIDVRQEPDNDKLVIRYVRTDTDETVRTRPMTEDELRVARQGTLPLRSAGTTSPLRGNTRGGQPS